MGKIWNGRKLNEWTNGYRDRCLCVGQARIRKVGRIRRGRIDTMSDTTGSGGATHVGIKKMFGPPFSSHLPRERLLRELPAVDHGDRSNDNPQCGS